LPAARAFLRAAGTLASIKFLVNSLTAFTAAKMGFGQGMLETPSQILAHHADPEACDSFTAWRKKIRKPLTDRAACMIAKTLAAINAAGGDATEALDMAQEHGWQTIKSDWYWKIKHGTGNSNQAGNTARDTADKQITFAATAIRTPGEDCF
jgi:hypothetical protein